MVSPRITGGANPEIVRVEITAVGDQTTVTIPTEPTALTWAQTLLGMNALLKLAASWVTITFTSTNQLTVDPGALDPTFTREKVRIVLFDNRIEDLKLEVVVV